MALVTWTTKALAGGAANSMTGAVVGTRGYVVLSSKAVLLIVSVTEEVDEHLRKECGGNGSFDGCNGKEM